jgi:hypothetical protein
MLTPQEDQLALLLERSTPTQDDTWAVPWRAANSGDSLDSIADAIVRESTGVSPTWIEQVGAFGDDAAHPSESELSVAFAALLPLGTAAPSDGNVAWFKLNNLPALPPRQSAIVQGAVSAVRDRMDLSPVAFRLLPPSFTLSELQQMYELLLGKRLHKASFRRALQAAWLVEPTDEWRSEGRGRPAQLYRYAPRKRRKGRRGVRFDLLVP